MCIISRKATQKIVTAKNTTTEKKKRKENKETKNLTKLEIDKTNEKNTKSYR